MRGFYSQSELAPAKVHIPLLPRCGVCKLHETCMSPKMPLYGEGKKQLLLVGEAPGEEEDKQNRPFVGRSGKYLRSKLRGLGIDMDVDCLVTNGAICRPRNNKIFDKAIEHCRPNLVRVVKENKPRTIILLGKRSVQSLMGWLWKKDSGKSIERWVGWTIPCKQINAWICPTWHPAYISRVINQEKGSGQVLERIFEKHLAKAVSLSRSTPSLAGFATDFDSSVSRELDSRSAARMLSEILEENKPISFDYETTTLLPDGKYARIVCCSVSNGDKTIAYPWTGDAIIATRDLLWSDIPKIGFNAKFEERWTKKVFGKGVKNWKWDGMLAAHTLDNRKGICSLKFQSFVRLGVPPYDEHIAPFLKADSANEPNRIEEVKLEKLLLYCGTDSYLEWKLAQIQMNEIGRK